MTDPLLDEAIDVLEGHWDSMGHEYGPNTAHAALLAVWPLLRPSPGALVEEAYRQGWADGQDYMTKED